MKIELLEKVAAGTLSPRKAYRQLFKLRRPHFYKLRININEAKYISRFINLLFWLPAPLFIIRLIIQLSFKDIDRSEMKLVKHALKYLPADINIDADEVNVKINAL